MSVNPLLLAAARASRSRREALEEDPLLAFRPLPGQHAVLSDPSQFRLFRGPNQALGKTTCGAVDTLCSAIGRHPWCPDIVTDEAGEWWVICASWSQSVAIQKKLYELAPKHLLHPRTEFNALRGFRGTTPAFQIRHLPSGDWSTIRIKTTQQGGLVLAGATITGAWFDEPPKSPRIWSEIQKRVLRAGKRGRVLLTMTPVNARVDWIKEMAESGMIIDHHHRLEPQELIPVGAESPLELEDGTPMDEAWLDAEIAKTLPHEVPVVCHGEWSMAAEAPVFTAYRDSGPDSHVTRELPSADVEVELVLGIDHGVRAHTQTAVLLAVARDPDAEHPVVWVLDEYVSPGETTEDDDARAILDMLEGHGQRWDNLAEVWGDRAHHGSARRYSVASKSNSGLMAALERVEGVYERHGIRKGLVHPPIRSAKRGVAGQPGSVSFGCTWLHRLMLRRGHFHLHPRCTELRTALQSYDMTPNSPESHIMDALRYALRGHIFRRVRQIPRQTVHVH